MAKKDSLPLDEKLRGNLQSDSQKYSYSDTKNSRKFEAREEDFQAQVKFARGVNLLTFFSEKGYKIERAGQEYYIKDLPGLCINPEKGIWFNHYTQTGGSNSIDCLTKNLGLSFNEAVRELSGRSIQNLSDFSFQNSSFQSEKTATPTQKSDPITYSSPLKIHDEKNSKPLEMPPKSDNTRRVFAYLTQTRKIPSDIVNALIKSGKLYQDERGNAVFVHTKNGTIVGAEIQGTVSNVRYKGIAPGTADSVFTVPFSRKVETVFAFESSIDLMSFAAVMGSQKLAEQNAALVSMGGLKPNTLREIESLGVKIYACVDNDEKGMKFADDNGFERFGATVLEEAGVKDWNELLQKVPDMTFEDVMQTVGTTAKEYEETELDSDDFEYP